MEKLKSSLLIFMISFALIITGVNTFIACSSDGEKCDSCKKDDDCKDELWCAMFTDGKKRCVKSASTTCKTYGLDIKETHEVKQLDQETDSDSGGITNPY